MIARGLLLLFLGGGLGLMATVPESLAQTPTEAPQNTVLAQFEEARALAVDPGGRLYVADAGRDIVVVLDRTGTRRMVLGGSGTRAGAFDTPSDVEPTNGQLVLVADTYNGRVQRFSEEGQYLESLPIGRTNRFEGRTWSFEDGRTGDPVRGDGRPLAVARDNEGGIYVLDDRERRLLKWSDVGRPERIVKRGSDRLQHPVALAVGDARRLYVADAGQERVLVYDTFGTFRRRVPVSPLPTVRALTVYRGRLYIVCADRLLVWERTEGLVAEHPVDLSEPIVDAVLFEGSVYMLTATRLLRRNEW